jgi:hypothetical protein
MLERDSPPKMLRALRGQLDSDLVARELGSLRMNIFARLDDAALADC